MARLLLIAALPCALAGEIDMLHGSGTTNPSRLFWEVMDLMMERSHDLTHMTYRGVGSSTGQKEFVGSGSRALLHFGSGDIPMTKDRYDNITSSGREMFHIPFALGGIGVFHSVPTIELNASKLDLNGCVLAKIFSRSITKWNDPEIVALNPGIKATADIKVVHRVHGSSSTSGFTEYLQTTCPDDWQLDSGSTITWPTDTFDAEGSSGMSDFIAGNEYAIGYIDSGHGHAASLSEVALENKDGVKLTTKEANISSAADYALANDTIPADPSADFSSVNLYDLEGPSTWPITMISYLYVDKNQTATERHTAGLLVAFVRMLLSSEGQKLAVKNLFSRLPQALIDYNAATIANIALPSDAPPYSFETETAPLTGAGPYVFSGKRRTYAEYQRNSNAADIASMTATIASLQAKVAALEAASAGGSGAQIVTLHGAGTTNPSKLFWQAMDLIMERSRRPIRMDYRAVGSSTGQREFVGPSPGYQSLNDFGAGDIPMTKERYDTIATAGRKVLHLPFALGAIGVFHSVPTGEIQGSLSLTGCLLAKIFSGQITRWDDPEIVAVNPEMVAAADIKIVHRKEGSSSTAGFTEYLNTKCPSSWSNVDNPCGANGCGTGSTITWPADSAVAEGSGGMASYIASTPYAIGYIDAGHGHDASLSEVALQNNDGQYLTTKQADVGEAATVGLTSSPSVIPADPSADFSSVELYDLPGPATWPITMISYFYINQDLSSMNPDTAGLLVYFIEFILSEEGQALASNEFNLFTKLPSALLDYNTNALNTITLPSLTTRFTSETSTLALTGAGSHVISVKRRSYAELERERIASSVSTLQSTTPVVTDQPTTPAVTNQSTTPAVTDDHLHEEIDDAHDMAELGLALGAAGLVLGIVALLLALYVIARLNRKAMPRSAEITARNLDPPPSCTKTHESV